MGCVGSKQFHGANLHKSARPPSSTSNHSDSLRHLATYDSTKGQEEEEPEEAADSTAATPLALPDQVLIVTDKEEAPGVDANAAPEPKPKLSLVAHVPNGVDWEHVAAGWPRWLTQVATEAVRGWLPRKSDSFHKLHKIGEGTYSSVYKAHDLENGKVVALKKVRFANMDPESVRFMAREIHVLRRLDHPHVVKLEGLVTSHMSSSLYLVFEYMEHDLAGLAATPGIKFTEPQVKCYMQQLLSGLDHCHSHGVLHRDIKGANLLLDNNGTLKIADFGLATFFNPNQKQHLTSRVVTLWYRPPELLLGATNYGAAVDLWSAGCILAELLSGRPIMPGRTEVEQLHKIFKLCGSPSEEFWASLKLSRATVFKPQHLYHRCVNNVYKGFSSSALELLDQLLAVDPASRGTAASALESEIIYFYSYHQFFTTKPHACDPSSLPKYPPSKEYDAKLRDEEIRRKRMIALKGQNNETRRRKQPQSGNGDLQQRRAQANRKGTRMDDGIRGFRIDPPARVGENGIAQRVPLLHAGRSSSTLGRSNETDEKTQRFYTSQMPNLSCAAEPRGGATRSSNHGDGAKRPHLREHPSRSRYRQLTAVDSSGRSEWTHQFQERPSSSHRKEGGAANKEHTVVMRANVEACMAYHQVNGSKKNRIHYSGPLMPHGGNMEEILKEHERQIQQAVRRARMDNQARGTQALRTDR
ncbi:probable serine/threonine-protein kinase At1g54610 isoform X1 [Oryza sativa Japonica Group]|uniref:probable serine/threonine-protein kinase At1g54610 isoform X1 n=1 Tax=Oryza sativa subsp. japonica TaxID=39947 RepID=UPI00339C42F7